MKKIYLWLVFLIIGISMFLTGFVINASDITNGESIKSQYKLGMIPVEKTTYYSLGIAKNAQLTQELPEKVDFTDKFPLPGDQGRQGSCVGWATAYALKSYLEKVDFDWDQNLLEHKFSPAYVYNQINGGRDKGAQIPDALNLIVKQGVCSLAVMPYSDQNYKTQPNSTQKAEAAKFKSASWSVVKDDVNEIKAQLAAGNAVVLGIPVYDDFFDLTASNDVYDNTEGELAGYHAICLVGYDDSKQAFKLINSWGTEQWGLNG